MASAKAATGSSKNTNTTSALSNAHPAASQLSYPAYLKNHLDSNSRERPQLARSNKTSAEAVGVQ